MMRGFATWFFLRPWRFWFVAVACVAPVLVYRQWAHAEDWYRYHSLALQFVGLVQVVRGLNDTAERFSVPSGKQMVRAWLASFPHGRLPHVQPPFETIDMSQGVDVHCMPSYGQHENATDQQRIQTLEQNVDLLRRQVMAEHTETVKAVAKVRAELQADDSSLRRETAKTRKLVEDQFASGMGEGYQGLAFVFFGTIYSSLTPEFLKWFG
jgi:hypothetical protein